MLLLCAMDVPSCAVGQVARRDPYPSGVGFLV
jgi:hypothetical protein